jgi:hypothetical protein
VAVCPEMNFRAKLDKLVKTSSKNSEDKKIEGAVLIIRHSAI